MADLKKGDTVRLKSGGPIMTIGETINGKFECHWFNQTGVEYTHKSEILAPELLKSAALQGS